MHRKSFFKTLIGGVASLPFIDEANPEPEIENNSQEIVDKPKGLTYYSGEMYFISESGKMYALKQEKNGAFAFKKVDKAF